MAKQLHDSCSAGLFQEHAKRFTLLLESREQRMFVCFLFAVSNPPLVWLNNGEISRSSPPARASWCRVFLKLPTCTSLYFISSELLKFNAVCAAPNSSRLFFFFHIHLQSEASFSALSLYIRGGRWARQSVTNFGSLCRNDEGSDRGDVWDLRFNSHVLILDTSARDRCQIF